MSYLIRLLISIAVALAPLPMLAQERQTLPSIANAKWDSREYNQSPLCAKDEITLWTCERDKRVFSLCSSQTVTRTSGYMQYRTAHRGQLELVYPAERKPPLGSFVYNSFANGNASVEFENKGYRYHLIDPLREASSLFVEAPAPSRKTSEIQCGGNQTLQLNYTMRLMHESGLWKAD